MDKNSNGSNIVRTITGAIIYLNIIIILILMIKTSYHPNNYKTKDDSKLDYSRLTSEEYDMVDNYRRNKRILEQVSQEQYKSNYNEPLAMGKWDSKDNYTNDYLKLKIYKPAGLNNTIKWDSFIGWYSGVKSCYVYIEKASLEEKKKQDIDYSLTFFNMVQEGEKAIEKEVYSYVLCGFEEKGYYEVAHYYRELNNGEYLEHIVVNTKEAEYFDIVNLISREKDVYSGYSKEFNTYNQDQIYWNDDLYINKYYGFQFNAHKMFHSLVSQSDALIIARDKDDINGTEVVLGFEKAENIINHIKTENEGRDIKETTENINGKKFTIIEFFKDKKFIQKYYIADNYYFYLSDPDNEYDFDLKSCFSVIK